MENIRTPNYSCSARPFTVRQRPAAARTDRHRVLFCAIALANDGPLGVPRGPLFSMPINTHSLFKNASARSNSGNNFSSA